MPLSKEELLLPRFKVAVYYPSSPFKVGDIVECADREFGDVNFYKKYPGVFKPIEWWEEREMTDLPGYVRVIRTGTIYTGLLFRYEKGKLMVRLRDTGNIRSARIYLPATKEEYEAYLSSKSKSE